jgi:hypothetical protein
MWSGPAYAFPAALPDINDTVSIDSRNAQSRAVARKIGLVRFGSDLHIT